LGSTLIGALIVVEAIVQLVAGIRK